MSYKINEIFHSMQCEGSFAGVPAIFIRFSECNLNCHFCDTDFKNYKIMSKEDIIARIKMLQEEEKMNIHHIIFTGGEPSLQLDMDLCLAIRSISKFIHVETNGLRPFSVSRTYIDHMVMSPKTRSMFKNYNEKIQTDDLKLLVSGDSKMIDTLEFLRNIKYKNIFFQPIANNKTNRPSKEAYEMARRFAAEFKGKVSIQMHKYLEIR